MKIHIEKVGHVRERMKERGITESDISEVLENPSTSWSSGNGKSKVFSGSVADGRVIRVVVIDPPEIDGTLIVKTAYDPPLEA